MNELSSYVDYLENLSKNEPRTCLARYYPKITFHYIGDIGAPPVGKCFNSHNVDCTTRCIWHPDNPDKEERIKLAGVAASEKNIQLLNIDMSSYWEEQRRKWQEWEEKTFKEVN